MAIVNYESLGVARGIGTYHFGKGICIVGRRMHSCDRLLLQLGDILGLSILVVDSATYLALVVPDKGDLRIDYF